MVSGSGDLELSHFLLSQLGWLSIAQGQLRARFGLFSEKFIHRTDVQE